MIILKELISYKNYFESIATSHVDIQGFVYHDTEEMMAGFKSKHNYPLMYLEPYSTRLQDQISDNYLGRKTGSLVIMKKSNSNEAPEAIEAAAETIVCDIISKILKDYQAGDLITEVNGFNYDVIDPIFVDRLYGIRLEFNFHNPLPVAYNEAKWQ